MKSKSMNAKIEAIGPTARLAQTRAQLQEIFDPEVIEARHALRGGPPGKFPRSATLKFLLGGQGKGAIGLLLTGFLATRRASIGRWSRYLSVGSLLSKAVAARMMGRTGPQ